MYSKTTLVVVLFTFICSCTLQTTIQPDLCTAAPPITFYVGATYDSSTPGWHVDHFDSIQDAIDNASTGYAIVVYNGTYTENVVVDKTLTIIGEDRDITIIDGDASGDVISVTAANVNITHFTLTNSGTAENDTIVRIAAGNAILTDLNITGGHHGIVVQSCNNNIIYDNIICENSGDGIRLIRHNTTLQSNPRIQQGRKGW